MAVKKNNEKWLEILSRTRENYLRTIGVLGEFKNEFDNVVNSATEKHVDFNDETLNIIKEWIIKTGKMQKDFQNTIRNSIRNTFFLIPHNFMPNFEKEINTLIDNINNNFKKIIEKSPVSWFFK